MTTLKRFLICLTFGLLICLGLNANSVTAATRTPKLNVKSLYLVKGGSYKLNIYNMKPDYHVEFESDNPKIVTVKKPMLKSCRLKAKTLGNTTVFAVVYDENDEIISELECKVTVSTPAVSIKFAKKKIKVTKGTSSVIKTLIKPYTSKEKPKFISDNPDIVTISSTGVIFAATEGQTIVRATLSNGREAKCTVIVLKDKPDNDEPATTETPAPSFIPHSTPEPVKKSEKTKDRMEKLSIDDGITNDINL